MDVSTRTDALQESLDELVTLACRDAGWRHRSGFHAVASLAMRHVLVDRTKSRVLLRRVLES